MSPSHSGPSNETRAEALFQQASANSSKPAKRILALRQINEAIQLNPNVAHFYTLKATLLAEPQDKNAEALSCLDKALALEPKNSASWFAKSQIMMNENKPEIALQCADKALAYADKSAHGLITASLTVRFRALQKLHRYEEAMKDAEKCIKVLPKNDVILSSHAEMAKQLKQWPVVVKDKTRIIEIRQKEGNVYALHLLHRAEAYTALHQIDKAIADMEEVVRLNPGSRKAHRMLLELYRKKKDNARIAKEEAIIRSLETKQAFD